MSGHATDRLPPRRSAGDSDNVIIVGGGIAGLFCALKLSPRPVTIVTAAPLDKAASSAWAQTHRSLLTLADARSAAGDAAEGLANRFTQAAWQRIFAWSSRRKRGIGFHLRPAGKTDDVPPLPRRLPLAA